jgi:glutamyl-tRNA synthetase
MHLGNALAALLAWSGVRAAGGRLVMRVEDLDPRAANAQVAQDLLADLAWLGLEWDGAPLYQSARGDAYREAVAYLARRGLVYPCFCSRQELHAASAPHASDGTYRYAGTCRGLSLEERARRSRAKRPALRVAVPATGEAGTIAFCDAVCGPQEETLAATCGDFLVRRSDGVYSYQLAVVVDDLFQGVNQVVRGNDLLGSTARQMWLARELAPCVLGTSGAASAAPATPPATTYAHVPLLTDSQGRRLCKRDGDLELAALRSRGVTPQAVLGFLAHALGLAEAGEPLDAAGFLRRFSWEAIAAAPRSIPVDASSLLA